MGFPGIAEEITSRKRDCEKSPFRCRPSEGVKNKIRPTAL